MKNITNLLKNPELSDLDDGKTEKIYCYRKKRYNLHLDDKVLPSWNGLMLVALLRGFVKE